jgi:hypothetical protein
LAARMARLTSDFRNVDAALDIASGFSFLFALAVFLILTGERGVIKGQRLHHRGRLRSMRQRGAVDVGLLNGSLDASDNRLYRSKYDSPCPWAQRK